MTNLVPTYLDGEGIMLLALAWSGIMFYLGTRVERRRCTKYIYAVSERTAGSPYHTKEASSFIHFMGAIIENGEH